MICEHCNIGYDDKLEWCPNCQEPNPNLMIQFKTGEWSTEMVSVRNYIKSLVEVSKGRKY